MQKCVNLGIQIDEFISMHVYKQNKISQLLRNSCTEYTQILLCSFLVVNYLMNDGQFTATKTR